MTSAEVDELKRQLALLKHEKAELVSEHQRELDNLATSHHDQLEHTNHVKQTLQQNLDQVQTNLIEKQQQIMELQRNHADEIMHQFNAYQLDMEDVRAEFRRQ